MQTDPNMGPYGTVKADKTTRIVGTIVFVVVFILVKVAIHA